MLETEPLVTDEASLFDPVNRITGRELRQKRAHRDEESLLLLLPSYTKKRAMRDPVNSLDSGEDTAGADDSDEDEPRRALRTPRQGRTTVMYRVGTGDTLIGVARQFAMDIEDVARENHLEADAKLRAGSLLKLRVRREMLDEVAKSGGEIEPGKGDGDRDGSKTTDSPKSSKPSKVEGRPAAAGDKDESIQPSRSDRKGARRADGRKPS
jgi:membrane-bound lytic murein transglycosylase D